MRLAISGMHSIFQDPPFLPRQIIHHAMRISQVATETAGIRACLLRLPVFGHWRIVVCLPFKSLMHFLGLLPGGWPVLQEIALEAILCGTPQKRNRFICLGMQG